MDQKETNKQKRCYNYHDLDSKDDILSLSTGEKEEVHEFYLF